MDPSSLVASSSAQLTGFRLENGFKMISVEEIAKLSDMHHRRLTGVPWWGDLIVILGLAWVFYLMLRVLKRYSDKWKKSMADRILKALEARKLQKDPFRTENGYSWDYVMVFKVYKSNLKLNAKQKNSENTLKGIVETLAEAGLQTKLFYSVQNDEVFCKIRAPLKRLLAEADRIGYNLLLDENAISNALSLGNKSGPKETWWDPVVISPKSEETTLDPYSYIYGKFSQKIFEKTPIYKTYSNNTMFRGVDRLKLISSIIKARKENGGCQIDTNRLITDKCILSFFPLHDFVELRSLEDKWMKVFQLPWHQSVNTVKDYFGEKVGLYFLWLGHYTTYLMGAACVGVFSWFFVAAANNDPNSPITPYFAAFIAIWSSFYFEFWKRKEKDYAMRWGMVGFEENVEARPEFQGEYKSHPVTGEQYLYFSRNELLKRLTQSSFVIVSLIALVIGLVASIFYFRITASLSGDLLVNDIQFAGIIASLLNAVQIQFMNYVYGIVSVQLNDFENHRTDVEYEDALIAKTFVFQFVNSFVSLFYVSFVKPYIQSYDPCVVSCMNELQTALSTIFLTRLATGNLLKILLPSIDKYMREKNETKGVKDLELSEVEKLYFLTPFDASKDTFSDYAEMIIQFGYTTMFIVAYPLATVMSFVNNYVQMRVMAWKMCQLCRRPEPRSAEDIGTWAGILEIMTVSAVLTNSALVAFTGTLTQDYTWVGRIWIFIGMSFGILATKHFIAVMVPDVSKEVEIQLERQDFIREKLIDGKGDEDDSNLLTQNAADSTFTIRITDDDPL